MKDLEVGLQHALQQKWQANAAQTACQIYAYLASTQFSLICAIYMYDGGPYNAQRSVSNCFQ